MEKLDDSLKTLLVQGKEKGYLTYSQVNDHLPDDDANPEKIDQLLILLEDQGIELIDESEVEEREGSGGPVLDDETRAELDLSFMDEEDSRRIDDPVRRSPWPRRSRSPASASAARCWNATGRCTRSWRPSSASATATCRSTARSRCP